MTLSSTTTSIMVSAVYEECHAFYIVMLSVFILNVIMLNVVMQNVFIPSVILLHVVIPSVMAPSAVRLLIRCLWFRPSLEVHHDNCFLPFDGT